jgi:putative copper export protein
MADRSKGRTSAAAQRVESGDGDVVTEAANAGSNGAQAGQAAPPAPSAAGVTGAERAELLHRHPAWAFVTGAAFGGLTLLFFMALVLLAAFDRPIPCESRFLVVVVLALGGALASSFIGGSAAAKGEIPFRIATRNPIGFSVFGGIAVLLLLMVVGHFGYETACAAAANDPINTAAAAGSADASSR